MMSNYSQFRAFRGILGASLNAAKRNISSLVFGLVFPIIFILVFGFIGGGTTKLNIALKDGADTNNPIYQALSSQENIDIEKGLDSATINEKLKKGQIQALIGISSEMSATGPHYAIDLTTTNAAPQQGALLSALVGGVSDKVNLGALQAQRLTPPVVTVKSDVIAGREYKAIDFILPGQLGFSLLSVGVFATAFVFLTLRQTLVIKRFLSTPVSKFAIILGEGVSRLIVALIQASLIIGIGHFAFGFTMLNGIWTFLQMLVLSAIGLIVFLGFGFVISSVAKDERTVPPFAQLVTLPQFLLAGTFFPVDQFPNWLQPIAKIMPLTFFNDAMRKIAFEGANLTGVTHELFWLMIWGIGIYALAVKVFRWEA